MANSPFSPGLLPSDNPISQWVSPRRNALLGFGAGMLSPGLSGAATGAMQGMALDRQYADAEAKKAEGNVTMEWVKANYPQYANLPVEQAADLAFKMEAAKKSGGSEAFTLGAGETRYGPDGSVLAQGAPDQQDQFGNEKDLFAQYSNSDPVKMYETVKGGYERVRQSAALQTGAGDMGLIYGYMKMLDPGSVVRESEFATAAQAGSYGQQIQGLVSRIINGERLPEEVRQQFVQSAEGIYSETSQNLGDINNQFSTRAQNYGVDPSMFIRQPESYQPINGIVQMPNGNTVRPM